ncbi:MAG: MBOAT family protein, partial [Sulfuricurvum sp.]|nr:MBOAT family protein [Sulfuricurvum sp.]MDD2951225.1 MBOAT family protein [Sulfuricurvum sp.]MDD5119579.1 MBOAT family protein [Sulfuricurvum sp.]
MWGWLGWFITFNFVNMAWVFFRSKDWPMAQNVLSGMIGLNGIVLPDTLASRLGFLEKYSVEFGLILSQIGGPSKYAAMLLFLGAILYIKNSNEMASEFVGSLKNKIFVSLLLFAGITLLARHSEFLYFRF